MGNRAVISFKSDHISKDLSPSIYLHWNGGRDSVEAFLEVGRIVGIRWNDPTYACARLAQIIGTWMRSTSSLGVGVYANLHTDNYDNGVYWVKSGQIVDREFAPEREQASHGFDEFVEEILLANRHAYSKEVEEYLVNKLSITNED